MRYNRTIIDLYGRSVVATLNGNHITAALTIIPYNNEGIFEKNGITIANPPNIFPPIKILNMIKQNCSAIELIPLAETVV